MHFTQYALIETQFTALRRLRRENPTEAHVFVSERGGPISPMGFHQLIARLGKAAKMPFAIHPHMLRHACGFKLANDGHDTRALQHYLGHRNIQHTVRYMRAFRNERACASLLNTPGSVLPPRSRMTTTQRRLPDWFSANRRSRRSSRRFAVDFSGLAFPADHAAPQFFGHRLA
jgi:Phage integrase family